MNTATLVCLVIPFITSCILLIGLLFGFHVFKQAAVAVRDVVYNWLQTK